MDYQVNQIANHLLSNITKPSDWVFLGELMTRYKIRFEIARYETEIWKDQDSSLVLSYFISSRFLQQDYYHLWRNLTTKQLIEMMKDSSRILEWLIERDQLMFFQRLVSEYKSRPEIHYDPSKLLDQVIDVSSYSMLIVLFQTFHSLKISRKQMHRVVEKGLVHFVQYLIPFYDQDIERDCSVPIKTIQQSDYQMLKFLLDTYPGITRRFPNLILLAIKKNNIEIVQLLLDHNLDLNRIQQQATITAASNEKLEILKLLVSSGLDLRDTVGIRALKFASANNYDKVVEYLINQGVDCRIENDIVLFRALENKNLDLASKLLQIGLTVYNEFYSEDIIEYYESHLYEDYKTLAFILIRLMEKEKSEFL